MANSSAPFPFLLFDLDFLCIERVIVIECVAS